MSNFDLTSFLLGGLIFAIVVDFLWAYKMGLVQLIVARFKYWRANRSVK